MPTFHKACPETVTYLQSHYHLIHFMYQSPVRPKIGNREKHQENIGNI